MGSDGSPYEKRVDAKGRVLSDKCIADEVPFEKLPEGWAWARLSSLFTKIGSGSTPAGGRKVYQDEGPMLIRSQNVHNDGLRLDDVAHFPRSLFESRNSHVLPNDVLLNITGASIGRCAIVPDTFGDADVNQHVLIMRPVNDAVDEYLHVAIISPVVQIAIMIDQVGATKEGLSATKAANLLIPLPPLPEQHRIVERVGELTPLVEEYGKLEDAREELDSALPGRLRKSVLQMAVQGKLVPQDPADEPASELLERIRGQRRQLIAEKKMKAPKGGESAIYTGSDGRRYEKRVDAKGRESEPVCIENEIPFDVPETWVWARLESVASISGGATPDRGNPAYWDGEIPWASMKDIHGDFLESTLDSITKAGLESKASISMCEPGNLIVSTRLVPGKSIISRIKTAINQDLKVLHLDEFDVAYLHFWFQSQLDIFKRMGSGTTVPGIKLSQLSASLISIPPLAEQHRISERIEELMPFFTNR